MRAPKTEAQDPRSFKAEEAVRPPTHGAEDPRSSQPNEAEDPSDAAFAERSLEFMALMMDSMKEMHKN